MQQNNVQPLASFSLNALVFNAAQQPAPTQNEVLSKMPHMSWSLMTPAQKSVFPLLCELSEIREHCAPLRVPAPSRAQWVEVFGEAGENPHLPRALWQDELADEETAEHDYWAWVVASYPPVWGVNCDGVERKPLGRPLPAGLGRPLVKRAA